jgi:DNA-binding LytR/AlgR family response regulator
MIKIALCDDDKKALPIISGAATSALAGQKIKCEIEEFDSGKKLLLAMDKTEYQLVLLDIDMPGMDGIQVGKTIREKNYNTKIVYVSECESRVFESLAVQPLGFVRKSNFLNDIAAVVQLFIKTMEDATEKNNVEFDTRTGIIVLQYKNIAYIESSRNYQLVTLKGQKSPVEIKMTMDKLEKMLDEFGFIRIHKGFLVNYRFIQRISSNEVILQDGTALPIGRSKAPEIKSKYLALI